MAYNASLYIFIFLPICLAVYQMTPEKHRWKVLLGFSWLFFYMISGKLIVYLLGTTLLTHYIGIWLTWLKTQEQMEIGNADRMQKKEIKKKYQKKAACRAVSGSIDPAVGSGLAEILQFLRT